MSTPWADSGQALPPECVRLAEALRELRARSGLSLAALSSRTAYSKSSWERYLNGKTLPPRHAVVALCQVARAPAGRPLALWELAEAVWSGRGAAGAEREGTALVPGPAGAAATADAGDGGEAAGAGEAPGGGGAVGTGEAAGAGARGGGRWGGERWRGGRWGAVRLVAPAVLGAAVCAGAFALTLLLWPSPSHSSPPSSEPAAPGSSAPASSARDEGGGQRDGDGGDGGADRAEGAEAARDVRDVVVGCRDARCTGKDPVQMRCGAGEPPRTLRTLRVGGRTLDVRFQPECGAAWVRMWGQRVGDRVEVRAPGAEPQSEVIDDEYETGQRRSTPMVAVAGDDIGDVRACLVSRRGTRECFAAHT
ncbi:helix-turn-helix domain-containing protein [Streptomyces iconiensis]|uniref:DUF2690 domain-containing protein n=1 Tax=Streptomyces iconiensis TaxID=1384038 RepID=A0ABT7A3U5_9ACTN|nr:XRE family transcriptional regulator [Streptomyces iconiensis]MDJ1135989.1 DUF2690 domain-containing protein [Streptomyces iconiensis]